MNLNQMLDRPIAYHRVFVELTGSVLAAVMLSQALYWQRRTNGKNEFWKTMDEWEEETGLSRREQETARRALRKHGFWKEERKGVPAKLYFSVDLKKLENSLCSITQGTALDDNDDRDEENHSDESTIDEKQECANPPSQFAQKRHSSLAHSAKLECPNPPNYIHRLHTETTAENTAKITDSKESAKNASLDSAPRVYTPLTPLNEGGSVCNPIAGYFKEFWERYPKKHNQGKAWRAYKKFCKGNEFHGQIMAGLERAIASEEWSAANGRFIPYPANWLEAFGWLNDYRPAMSFDDRVQAIIDEIKNPKDGISFINWDDHEDKNAQEGSLNGAEDGENNKTIDG